MSRSICGLSATISVLPASAITLLTKGRACNVGMTTAYEQKFKIKNTIASSDLTINSFFTLLVNLRRMSSNTEVNILASSSDSTTPVIHSSGETCPMLLITAFTHTSAITIRLITIMEVSQPDLKVLVEYPERTSLHLVKTYASESIREQLSSVLSGFLESDLAT